MDIFDEISGDIFDEIAPEKTGIYEEVVKPSVKSIPRVVGATVGGLAAFPVSGMAGLARLLTTGSLEEAEKTRRAIQEIPMRLLKTPEQKKSMEYIGQVFKPFEMAGEGWRLIGEKTGLPYAEPVLGTMGEAAAIFGAGGRGIKRLKGRPAQIARGIAAKEVEALRTAQEAKYGRYGVVPKEKVVTEGAPIPMPQIRKPNVFDEIASKKSLVEHPIEEAIEPTKAIPKVKPEEKAAPKPTEGVVETLEAEAKKYKTAEEFVKSKIDWITNWNIDFAKKHGIRELRIGEKTKRGDVGYIQPGAKKFTPQIGIKYTNDMHPIYRKIAAKDVEPFYLKGATKSQLIDIWNKAHKTKPEKPKTELSKAGETLSFLGTQNAYNKIIRELPRLKKMGQQIYDLIDVEAKWRREGKPETGFAIKNIFSQRALHEEYALRYARDIAKDTKFNKEGMSRVALLAEQKNPKYQVGEEGLKTAVEKAQRYFEAYQREYAKRGVKVDFKQRIINEIEELLTIAEKPADIAGLQQALKAAKEMKFVHIPSAIWFKDFVGKDPAGAKSVLNLLVAQPRKSLNIQSLIDRKIIKPEDVNIVDIVASYGRRAGKDFAILDTVRAAEKEGLAVKGEREGFVPASHRAPILKGYQVHPLLADWIWEMTSPKVDVMNLFEKGLSVTKMSAFYNPLFLPMYDTVQGAMLGSLRSIKTPKYVMQGIKDCWKKTPEYYESLNHGLASKPFNNPLTSYTRMTANAKHSQIGMIATRLLESVLPHKAIQNIYNASWHIAWELDKTMRQISYRYLRDKGFSPKEAAQIAAKYHSDYASVPPKTRKVLNHIFFTPTFKITMGKLYGKMISNAVRASGGRAITDMYRGLAGKEKLGKLTPAQKKYAGGIVATAAILYGWDMYWKSQGFEADEWGRRYVKKVDTQEGKKELVMTWSNPANMFLKYGYRVQAAFKPDVPKPWVQLLVTNKWEFHPIWRTGYEIINNDNGRGDRIYSEFEPDSQKIKKSAIYATTHIIALLGLMDKDPSDVTARQQFKKEVGQVIEMATRPFTFKYMRSPEEKRKIYKINSIMKRFKQEIFRQQREKRKGDIPPAEKYKIFIKELQEIR